MTPPEPKTTGKSAHARLTFSALTMDHSMPSAASTGIMRVLKAISLGKKPLEIPGEAPQASA